MILLVWLHPFISASISLFSLKMKLYCFLFLEVGQTTALDNPRHTRRTDADRSPELANTDRVRERQRRRQKKMKKLYTCGILFGMKGEGKARLNDQTQD